MGNTFGNLGGMMRRRTTKVMKITGESFRLKTPVRAGSVLEKNPGHVLLESESVKHYGVRAKPLEPQQELKPNRLYFLVELPKNKMMSDEDDKATRRVRSGIQMSAKDRLESLMLARRSASDLYIMKPASSSASSSSSSLAHPSPADQGVRVRMRLPKAEVERLMAESKDGSEVAEKIVGLCMANGSNLAAEPQLDLMKLRRKQEAGADEADGNGQDEVKTAPVKLKPRQKRVGFLPITEGEIHLAVAS